jgi:hypothetical protein
MQVKVVNDNVHPYSEKFRGKDIYIGPKESILMDLNDAHLFLGIMPPSIEIDGNGIQKPTSYKMLRIEATAAPETAKAVANTKCMACNKDLQTKAGLEAHIAEEHADSMVDEEAREEVVQKSKGRSKKGG